MDNGIPKNEVKQCRDCKNLILGSIKCKAFPDGIPVNILDGSFNHKTPYIGDHGIRFELDAERVKQREAFVSDLLTKVKTAN